MKIFDLLSHDLGWDGIQHDIARTLLKNSLKKATEEQAFYYLKRINSLSGEVLRLQEMKRSL